MATSYSKKVLIIDSSKIIRLQIKSILEKNGFHVLELIDAEKYFQDLWKYKDVGLIILDINLPSANGVDVLARMRKIKASFLPPILILSGDLDKIVITKTIKLGAKDYILKPFNDNDLLQKVQQHCVDVKEILKNNIETMPKQLWGICFTVNPKFMSFGTAVIHGNSIAGSSSVFYFIGHCDISSNPASAVLDVTKFAPGKSILKLNNFTLILSGTLINDELSLTGYVKDFPEKKIISRLKKLAEF
ncbi:MAG: response regulator receiver modulated diguanylate cyclase [Firmicutes bacterium]|nr:response regulator receiver modulated diguanylate cyclase [Bacillota bacterium]